MRFSSVIVAIGAITSVVRATKVVKRGTYQVTSVLGSNNGYYPSPPSASSAPSSSCMTHNVMVGGSAGLVYTPDQIMANVGDTVIFTFGVKNHTLTQSTFAQPCGMMDGGSTHSNN
jgi:plastocyanin